MKLLRLAIGLFAAMALFTSAASAAPPPYAAGKAHEHRKHHKHQHHHKQPQHRYPPRHQQRRPQGQSQWLWQNQREMHRQSPPRHQHQHHHRPPHQHHRHPPHRNQLRRDIHRNSHHLRPAPPLPRHMHLVVGRPLPHGWRHPVPASHARHLPQYAGYEWHSAGRDLVLVAVTTGIVYSILDNVLN